MPIVGQASCIYMFCFFAYKDYSIKVAIPVARAFLFKTFLAVFAFSIMKIAM